MKSVRGNWSVHIICTLNICRCVNTGSGPGTITMSLFLDMKEFGEAAPFLRKTNLEQLAAQAQAFDGTVNWFSIVNSLRTDSVTSKIEFSSVLCGFREVVRANAGVKTMSLL